MSWEMVSWAIFESVEGIYDFAGEIYVFDEQLQKNWDYKVCKENIYDLR